MSDLAWVAVLVIGIIVVLALVARRGGGRSYLIRRPRRPRPYRRRRY